jgi:pyruvate,water dikinase
MTTASIVPERLDFPITWDNPADAELFWVYDPAHFGGQLTVLDFALLQAIGDGVSRAYQTLGIPGLAVYRHVNTYGYATIRLHTTDLAELATCNQTSEATVQELIRTLDQQWAETWLPEIQEHLAYWEGYDLAQATPVALAEHLRETVTRHRRLWELHTLVFYPTALALSRFDDFYQDLFGAQNRFGAYDLLTGLENKTVAGGCDLWQLSRQILAHPEVNHIFSTSATTTILAQLQASPAGRDFLTHLDAYLVEHGQRAETWGWRYPAWIEDPTPALHLLKEYISQPDRDLVKELADLAHQQQTAITKVKAQVANYPVAVRDAFEAAFQAASVAAVLVEDHGYWIDFRGSYQVRRVLLACGEQLLRAGILPERAAIFHLTPDEIAHALQQLGEPSAATPDYSERIGARQAELAQYAATPPLPFIGTMLAPELMGAISILTPIMMKVNGIPQIPSVPALLPGNAGSAGSIRGTARVIRTLADASRLQPGEILVTTATAPAWTPLFAVAAGVVTDTGGILSHCAVVAREYGIPAVVGVMGATAMIADGQWVEVDGNAGVVRLLGSQ